MPRLTAAVLLLAATQAAQAQFVNADFEIGNLTGWTVTPTSSGTTAGQVVEHYDIDGTGPRPTTYGTRFSVGNLIPSGIPNGIELTQQRALQGGKMYSFEFDWSVSSALPDIHGAHFALVVGTSVYSSQSSGSILGLVPKFGHIGGTFTPSSTGSYRVGVRITRPVTVGPGVYQYVDNFQQSIAFPACAADLTTGAVAGQTGYGISNGVLNNDDFFFYLAQFSAGNMYVADVTTSAVPGTPGYGQSNFVINNDDFFYYLALYSAGC